MPASHLGLWNVVGVAGGHRDVLRSGGGLWNMPALRLGSRDVLWLAETGFRVGLCSGIRHPQVFDRGTLWVLLVVTEMC
jgi:hypothetical protein